MNALNTTSARMWLTRLAISLPSSALLSNPQRSRETEPAMVPRVARLTPSARALRRSRPSGNQRTMARANSRSIHRRTKVQTRMAATRLAMNGQRCSGLNALPMATAASPRRSRRRATSSWVGRMMLCQNAGLNGEAARLVICELNWLRRKLTICVDRSRADCVSLVAWSCWATKAFFSASRTLRCWVRAAGSSGWAGPTTLSLSSSFSTSVVRCALKASAWR